MVLPTRTKATHVEPNNTEEESDMLIAQCYRKDSGQDHVSTEITKAAGSAVIGWLH